MSRFTFAAVVSLALSAPAVAQQVPGRDLLEFPLGLLAEAQPLSSRMPASLWNPASVSLGPRERGAIGVAGLTTPQEQGVQLGMIGGEIRVRPGLTATLSVAQASVSDIFKTETDPQSRNEIPYETTLLSLGVAGARGPLTVGMSMRQRSASFDVDRRSALSLDGGAVLDGVWRTPLRVAVSTFLFSPSRSSEAATYSAAADFPFLRRDSSFALRGGYAFSHTEGHGRDHYVFGTTAYRQLDASAGISQTDAFGHSARRLRLGVGLRYASYNVAFGREDGAAGFGASYQFLLTRVIR